MWEILCFFGPRLTPLTPLTIAVTPEVNIKEGGVGETILFCPA